MREYGACCVREKDVLRHCTTNRVEGCWRSSVSSPRNELPKQAVRRFEILFFMIARLLCYDCPRSPRDLSCHSGIVSLAVITSSAAPLHEDRRPSRSPAVCVLLGGLFVGPVAPFNFEVGWQLSPPTPITALLK